MKAKDLKPGMLIKIAGVMIAIVLEDPTETITFKDGEVYLKVVVFRSNVDNAQLWDRDDTVDEWMPPEHEIRVIKPQADSLVLKNAMAKYNAYHGIDD